MDKIYRVFMIILSVVTGLFVFWLFTSKSKVQEVKAAAKFTDEALEKTRKSLEKTANELGRKAEDNCLMSDKKRLIHLSELGNIDEINEAVQSAGLSGSINQDVTVIVEKFKEKGRFDEISHLVVKVDRNHPKLDKSVKRSYRNKERYIIKMKE